MAGKYRNIIVHDFRQKDTVDRYWGWDGHGETILVLPGIKKKRVTQICELHNGELWYPHVTLETKKIL